MTKNEIVENINTSNEQIVKVQMLIRKRVSEVFEAFINPDFTTKFWFTASTGKLEKGKQVTWTWEMYNHSVQVSVKELEQNKRILVEWGGYDEKTSIEWTFIPYKKEMTFVTITNFGFRGDSDKIARNMIDSKGGFTWVLAGAKALMEHNIELNLIADAYPKGLIEH